MIITIDGPTASGKSTVARLLAKHLDYYHLCSGLLFRALAYILHTRVGYQPDDFSNEHKDICKDIDCKHLEYKYDSKTGAHVFYKGVDVTPHLKNKVIDRYASLVATNKGIREALKKFQRSLAKKHNMIVEGRDSGSVVFPDADLKIFLTASPEARARRWLTDQKRKGKEYTYEQALMIVNERDARDKNRQIAPLVVPDGAVIVENSGMTLEQTVDTIIDLIKQKQKA